LNRLVPVELPGLAETRHLVIIDKVARTPDKYPRSPGRPAKRPLCD
jgi:16S rRNA (guanine527-N7)-methyltransferase